MASNTNKGSTDRDSDSKPHGSTTTKSSRDHASDSTTDTADEARRLSDQARRQVAGQAEQQKAQASDRLDEIGAALRETSDTLHDKDKDSVANLTEGAAQQIDRLSGYLRNRSVNDMLSEAKRFARRQPGMFLGGAAVLGFFGSRFFRSSEPDRTRHRTPHHR